MEKQLIISVGREFGSGGHEVAELLSKEYDIPLIDNKLLTDLAEANEISLDELRRYDEKPKSFLFSKTVAGFTSAVEENVAQLQFEYLRKMADEGQSFIVVGRCSEFVLKKYPCMVSVFVLGNVEAKCERIMKKYELSYDEARKLMKKKDWTRKTYHNYFCEGKWGDSRNYDLCINDSRLGTDGCARIIKSYIDFRLENNN